ncbi:MAG: plasmid mobilization relaxosome protein MobC [Pseudomonadota bacterium]
MVAERRIEERRRSADDLSPSEEAKANGQGGRGALSDAERRSVRKEMRWRPDEWAQVELKARAVGMTPTDFVRQRALGFTPKTTNAPDAALAAASLNQMVLELQRQGNNLNQLSKSVHTDTAFQQHWREIGQEVRVLTLAVHQALARVLSL